MDSNKLIFEQVAEMVENQILDELLNPEDQSPSTTDFANIYGINPATARKGLNILVDEGILYKKRGMGMFVTSDAKKIISEKRKNEYLTNILPDLIKNIQMLGISQDELIAEIEKNYKELSND
ncbi:GntR family transcriptional regulator [Anaerococcus sp. mt242]|uniref:GntR family transcriptional regulator n=1 Tax=unclassified Anaerococcus TaxID=2614126 RepID=UPI0019341FEC|nr:GntR family transcriptional regulator [Anaerococcus sp. mt242]MBM0046654.1 GntR family transcriptional regulator [Anaerococcus sp. mt242]